MKAVGRFRSDRKAGIACTEAPFGGPATDAMRRIGIQNGDTLNLQWAYLRDKPPTGPVIGKPAEVALPVPWASREDVFRRDAEIRAIREETQRARSIDSPPQKGEMSAPSVHHA